MKIAWMRLHNALSAVAFISQLVGYGQLTSSTLLALICIQHLNIQSKDTNFRKEDL